MIKYKKLFASLLTVFTVVTQASPVLNVVAEGETESEDHVKVTAENTQSDSTDPESPAADEEDSSDETAVPYTAADPASGVTSVTFSAELFKGADKEKDGYVWHAASNSIGHGVGYRVNYSMSGVAEIPANSIQIDMPVHIMKDSSDSYADTYEMALPTEEEFEETHQADPDTIFAYKELDRDGDGENDTIRVYNKVEAKAGQNGYFELAYYTSKQTMEYSDGAKTDPFKAVMSIGTKSWNTEEIPFTVDSSVSIDSAEQYYPTKYKSWQSSWGDAVKPADADRYIYLMYTVKSVITKNSSQKYTFSFATDISSKAGNVDIVGYKFSGNSTFQSENHADSQTLTDSRWDYVLVKYDKAKFTSANSYTVNAVITPTVTPAGGVDDATSKAVKQSFSWKKPVFVGLGGHIGVFVHGSGTWESDTDKQYYWDRQAKDYYSSDGRDYERYDLDELQDGNVASLDGIRFITHSDAYNGPWTIADGGNSKDPDSYFKKKVTSSLESGTKYLEDFADDVVIDNSYRFTSQPLTSDDYSLSYFTYRISNEYRTLDEDTLQFSQSTGESFDNETVYTFYAKYGKSGEWVKAGTYKPSTGKAGIADTAHVESITCNTVRFKNGSNAVSYKIETSNASYRTSIYVEEFINLKNSTTVMNSIKGKQIAYIANKADFHVYDEAGKELGSDTNWDFDRMIRAQKESEITKKAVSATNNRKQKQYAITWRVTMAETITSGAGGGTKQLIPQNGGVFYDLLPEGAVFNDSSIYVTDDMGNEISSSNYTVTATPNFRDTDRTMVRIDIASSAKAYMLYYDTIHSWNDIKDYGTDVVNPVAYETKNDKISNGYYDNPTKPSKDSMGVAFDDADLQKAFKGLDEADSDKPKFVYVKQNFDILAITAGSAGLSKKVLGDNSGNYSASGQTHTGGEYSYKIRYQNTFTTKASNLVFYDSLENYTTPEGKTSDWHGTLTGVGVNQMIEKGVSPAVYISTVENLDLNAHHDLSDTSVWTKTDSTTDLSSAKAVAIDARYTDDGSSYVLQPGESLTAYLYMKAPETDVAQVSNGYPYAYNNVYAGSTLADGSSTSDYFIHQDYSKIYYVVAGDLNMKKVNVNNTDEPISGIKYRLYGTSDYGNSVDMILDTAKDGTIAFKGVERGHYILQEYDCGDDWLMDPTEYNVTIDADGNTSVANGDYSTGVLTLTDAPRVHADVRFSKKNLVTNKNLEGAKFMLKGTSDYGNKVVKYATSSTTGITGVANIEKGTYDITEVETPNGYVRNDTVYTVVIDESGNYTMAVKSGDEDFIKVNGSTISVYNEPLHNVTILKQNNYDYSAVEGVTFKISGTSDKGTAVDQNQTTNKAGMATFTGIESGTYTLVETDVTDHTDGINVELDTTPRVITVDKYGNSTIEGTNKDSQGNTIIVDNAKSDKTITVIKKFNDDGTVDHSKDLPTIHASTNDPTKSSSAKSNEAAISEASLDDAQNDKSVVGSAVDGVKNVGKAIKNLFITETHAEETYTVTYDAGDGQFDDGSKTNTVTYTVKSDPVVKYSHTDNVDDTGKQNGNYGNNEKKTEVVTIPGADQLTVTVTYGGEGASWDYVSIFSGNHPDYTASSDHSKADIATQLGGGSHTSQTETYTVQGDSVTFAWKSDSGGCGDGYGYYATVTFSGKTVRGSYERPTAPEGKKLDGWAAAKNGAVVYPQTGIPDTEKITSNLTLYAVYSDFNWIDDWEYILDDANRTILLKKYNGDETTYKIPAKANINGTTYNTTIGNWNPPEHSNGNTDSCIPSLVTGTIKNLSFTSGIIPYQNDYTWLLGNNKNLQNVDCTHLTTNCVTDMSSMFIGCSSLTSLDVSHFDTSQVSNMQTMFYGCNNLTSLNVSHFDTSNVSKMHAMFYGCSKLSSLDVSHFVTSKVTSMAAMFYNCSRLATLEISQFDTSQVTEMGIMFFNCGSLTSLDVSHFDTSKVTRMGSMFSDCYSLTSLDVSHFDTSNVTEMISMFNGCRNLTSLDVSNFDTSKVTSMYQMFAACNSLTSLDLSNFDTSKVTSMYQMFAAWNSLTSLDLSNFDTSKVTFMYQMFDSCRGLISLDASHFNTSNVRSMNYMFSGCSSLTSLNVSHFDTSNVTEMISMFSGCSTLATLDVSNFDTSKVTNMGFMFFACSSLTSLDLSHFDTTKVKRMDKMFYSCSNLVSLDVSNFNTSNVTDMDEMFYGCSSLTSLDLSHFDTSKASIINIFKNCRKLTSLNMFTNAATFSELIGNTDYGGVVKNAVSCRLSRICLRKGNTSKYATKLGAFIQQYENSTPNGYTGNWTAFSEYNHANGSELSPDISYNGKKYVSLQQAYFSITDEQWAENPDGIWFVWEKEGQDPANQNYTSKAENFYTPAYDANGKVTQTPEQMFTKNGYWQKIDASTYSYTFYAVDTNRPFYIWEDEMAGYESSNTAANPIRIENGSETATITNTSTKVATVKKGSLTISKTVVNSTTTVKFPFTITLTKADGSALSGTKVFGDTAFKDGIAKTSLANGETLTIPDIPEGYHYTVAEDALSGYTVTSTNAEGIITGDQTATASFTNTAKVVSDDPATTGTLVLKKQGDKTYNGDFTLFLSGLQSNKTYSYTQQYENGVTGTEEFKTDRDGRVFVEILLNGNDVITINGLPDGSTAVATRMSNAQTVTSYTVESTTDNVVQESATGKMSDEEITTAEEPIAAGNTKTITFNDVVEITKDLTVRKRVDGTATDQSFEFTIDITGLKPNSVINTDTIGRITADTDGYATKSFYLKDGEGMQITGLPVGATYQITETGTPDYQGDYSITRRVRWEVMQDIDDRGYDPYSVPITGAGLVSKDMTTQAVTIEKYDESHYVTITNHYVKTYSMSVSNSVTGNMGDKSKTFSFTAHMPASLYGKTITTTKPDGSPAYTQVSSTGIANFTLKHGETIVFSGLTTDEITALKSAVNYGIGQESYANEGYKTTYNSSESNGDLKVSVTNNKSSGVPTGNHIGTGITASIIIGLGALMMLLKKKKDE